jgi:hypothetical protein
LVLLGYYYYSVGLSFLSSGTLPGSVDYEVVYTFNTSREVWFFIVDDFGSFRVVVVLLQSIQTI